MQKENFSESAPRCNGVHLQGEELVRLEMHYISNERVVTGLPRTGFFGSTASLTKEKTRRVGGAITESLCALILVENTLLEHIERERYTDVRSHLHDKCFYVLFRLHDLSTCLSKFPFLGNSLPQTHLYLATSCLSLLCCKSLQKRENCIPQE